MEYDVHMRTILLLGVAFAGGAVQPTCSSHPVCEDPTRSL